jgi:hypothetical protein
MHTCPTEQSPGTGIIYPDKGTAALSCLHTAYPAPFHKKGQPRHACSNVKAASLLTPYALSTSASTAASTSATTLCTAPARAPSAPFFSIEFARMLWGSLPGG